MTGIGRLLALYFHPHMKNIMKVVREENRELKTENTHLKSKIDMLEKYIVSNEERHVKDMQLLNSKIDDLSDRVRDREAKIDITLKELLFEREQSKLWMEHTSTLLERDPDISLLDLETLRKERLKSRANESEDS